MDKFNVHPMTGGYPKIPKEPTHMKIRVDGHLIASIIQYGAEWFLVDSDGLPMAQSRSYDDIRDEALLLIGD